MGRRRQGNWAEIGKTQRHSGGHKDTREAIWESYVRYDLNKHQLTISMAGWGMTDQDVESWCSWFRCYLDRIPTGGRRGDQIWAHEVNFAENRLTNAGVRCLLETFSKGKVAVLVLKLHHNQLTEGRSVAEFVVNSQGALRELHLSHNELDSGAAADIVLAAASACDPHGTFCYPSHSGHSAAPLWLRLEQNYVDPSAMAIRTDSEYEHLRPGKVLCNVSSRACTPHCCVKHRHDPPPVHAKHLSNQRSKPSQSSSTAASTAAAQDLLTMLQAGVDKSGKREEDAVQAGDRQLSKKGSAVKEEVSSAERVFADVLRWDEGEGKWIRDVIEILELKQEAAEDTGRVKLSQEVGNKLGNELKNMLGGLKRPEPKPRLNGESVLSSPGGHSNRFSKLKLNSPSTEGRDADSTAAEQGTSTPDRSGAQDEELFFKSPMSTISRRSRRGSQPFGSEVKQVNGFMLNPQAKEFYPTASPRQKVHELNLQAFLNPEAAEFTPQSSPEQLSKPFDGEALPPLPTFAIGLESREPSGNSIVAVATLGTPEPEVQAAATSSPTSRPSSSSSTSQDNAQGSFRALESSESVTSKGFENGDASCIDEGEWSIGKAFYSAFSAASAAVGLGTAMAGAKTQRWK